MNIDDKLLDLEIYFKEKKEDVIFNLIIRNYNKSNFYLGLVYNNNINKYKIAFVPLDIVEKNISEYVCYQFVLDYIVDYILKVIVDNKKLYSDVKFREKYNKNMNNYYIEINIYNKKEYKFKATRYLPKEGLFLYDVVVILFEHSPHIVSELCNEILENLNRKENIIEYNYSYDFDLYDDDYEKIINKKDLIKYSKISIDDNYLLEKVDDKYYMVMDNNIIILEYNSHCNIVNIFCDCKNYSKYLYLIIKLIREDKFIKFPKLKLMDSCGTKYYLCYGFYNNNFKVIHISSEKLISFDYLYNKNLKIISCDDSFHKELANNLSNYYSSSEIKNILSDIFN